MLELLRGQVEPEWIDYNGHMNVAYYHMAFDRATDRLLDRLGLGESHLRREQGSMFALEDHITYQSELKRGDPFRIEFQILDFDAKRLHYFLRLYHAEKGFLASTCEHLSIYVDFRSRRAAPMPERVLAELKGLRDAQAHLRRPEEAGRVMGIRRKT